MSTCKPSLKQMMELEDKNFNGIVTVKSGDMIFFFNKSDINESNKQERIDNCERLTNELKEADRQNKTDTKQLA